MGDVSVGSLPGRVMGRVGWDAARRGKGLPCRPVPDRATASSFPAVRLRQSRPGAARHPQLRPRRLGGHQVSVCARVCAPPSVCLSVDARLCARLSAGARRAGSRGGPGTGAPFTVPGGSAGRQRHRQRYPQLCGPAAAPRTRLLAVTNQRGSCRT